MVTRESQVTPESRGGELDPTSRRQREIPLQKSRGMGDAGVATVIKTVHHRQGHWVLILEEFIN